MMKKKLMMWCVCVCVCVCEVCAVAEKVIWDCLVEEPTLFLRLFLEKLTHRDRQDELVFLLRKLLFFVNSLPAQTAHCLFNYIVSSALYFKFIIPCLRSPSLWLYVALIMP